MFDPSTGRWFGEDPSGFAAGDLNLYRYAGNQPSQTDPSGLQPPPPTNLNPLQITFGKSEPQVPVIGIRGSSSMGLDESRTYFQRQFHYPVGPAKQLLFWAHTWELKAHKSVAARHLNNGVIAQFVKINFDLRWRNSEGVVGDRLANAEFKNFTAFKNREAYIEFWPIAKVSQNQDIISLTPDGVDSLSQKEFLTLRSQGYHPDAFKVGDVRHDHFACHVERTRAGYDIVGVIAIEGFALFINEEIITDGTFGADKIVVSKNSNRASGGLLSTPAFPIPDIKDRFKRSVAPLLPKRLHSDGLYRKVVAKVDTDKAVPVFDLWSTKRSVPAEDFNRFIELFSGASPDQMLHPLDFTVSPALGDLFSVASVIAEGASAKPTGKK